MPPYPKPFFRKDRRLWYVQINGSQINLGPDRDAAFAQYRDLMAAPTPVPTTPTTIAALVVVLCDKFLDWVQRNQSAGTYEWYRWRLQSFIRKYPKLTVDELKPYHVQEWVDSQQIAKTTQRNCIRAVKRAVRWSFRQGYIDVNPLTELEAPSAEAREVLISVAEYEELLDAIRDPAFSELVVTSWEIGCRPQESLRVETRHVDLKNQRWVFPKMESKTKRMSRVVYLTDEAIAITRRLMATYPSGRLFRNSHGDAWTNYAVQCAFRRVRARIGKARMKEEGIEISERDLAAMISRLKPSRTSAGRIIAKSAAELRAEAKRKLSEQRAITFAPRYSLYALRHSWATRALEHDVDPLTVATLMGHTDPGTLAKVYQHLALNPKRLLDELKSVAGLKTEML